MRIYYRFCDKPNRMACTGKEECLENFLSVFAGSAAITFIADSCQPENVQWLRRIGFPVHEVTVGSSRSFRHAVHLALEELKEPCELVYFVEDDYCHRKGALDVLIEGLKVSDYVTLYDQPDKYRGVYDSGEVSKVFTTESTHWKETISTCMTFGTKHHVLSEDLSFWERYL